VGIVVGASDDADGPALGSDLWRSGEERAEGGAVEGWELSDMEGKGGYEDE